jgi:hypothetical protein
VAGCVVRFERTFTKEFGRLDEDTQVELISHAEVLERVGPGLGRQLVDTLRGSAYANMKELRFNTAGGVWRVAFAFDPDGRAVLLVAGNKINLWGDDEADFYERLIFVADSRFKAYLKRVDASKKKAAAEAAAQAAEKGERPKPTSGRRRMR